jgi:hypothetical protein
VAAVISTPTYANAAVENAILRELITTRLHTFGSVLTTRQMPKNHQSLGHGGRWCRI